MTQEILQQQLMSLGARRKELGIPIAVLVKKTGLSRATVCRLLKGKVRKANIFSLTALAEALSVDVNFQLAPRPAEQVLRQQSERQAKRVAGIVQGTMSLEAQGLDSEGVATVIRQSSERLLKGPRKKLWWE